MNWCVYKFLLISFHCSVRYTFVTKHFKLPSQIPRKSSDSGLDFDRNKLSMCTPAASVREYYQTALPRAPRSRVLTILADRTRVESVQSLRADGPQQRRSTARFGPNSWRFETSIPFHVKHYLFKKMCIIKINKENELVCRETLLILLKPVFYKFRPSWVIIKEIPIAEWEVRRKLSVTYSMVQSPSWEANWFATSPRNSPHFTEPKGSLPHSQASATCLYPGPAQSSPYTQIQPPGDPS